jgi:antagonist of KipI
MNPSPTILDHDLSRGIETFSVEQSGLLTTVQDRGRFLCQWMGMPVSGALDQQAYRIGNILLAQDENKAGLEITYGGPQLKVLSDTQMVVTGADVGPKLNGNPFPMWTVIKARAGDFVTTGQARSGCRAYLCVKGGIEVPFIMGSRSTNLRLRIGGFQGRALRSGDRLIATAFRDCREKMEARSVPGGLIPSYPASVEVKVIQGPQRDYFDKRGVEAFWGSSYQVTAEANREGIRLEGPSVEIKKGKKKSIPSEACPPGGIQIRPNGKPIILMNDLGGGGYAKIAMIIFSDLPKVAQLKPGDKIVFSPIALPEAHEILREEEESLERLKAGFEQSIS